MCWLSNLPMLALKAPSMYKKEAEVDRLKN